MRLIGEGDADPDEGVVLRYDCVGVDRAAHYLVPDVDVELTRGKAGHRCDRQGSKPPECVRGGGLNEQNGSALIAHH